MYFFSLQSKTSFVLSFYFVFCRDACTSDWSFVVTGIMNIRQYMTNDDGYVMLSRTYMPFRVGTLQLLESADIRLERSLAFCFFRFTL